MFQLSRLAVRPEDSLGRVGKVFEGAEKYIPPINYDLDHALIIRSKAFKRLRRKTQVFVNFPNDHFRNRLTHSMEVSAVARLIIHGLARDHGIYLNERVAECVALAHDLGHPPFGHSGQDILNRLTKDYGGFEHNAQSVNIVVKYEKAWPFKEGIGLSFEVVEGLLCHNKPSTAQIEIIQKYGWMVKQTSLEAQIGNFADEIAYLTHDLEDASRAGIFNIPHLVEFQPMFARFYNKLKKAPGFAKQIEFYQVYAAVGLMRDYLIKKAVDYIAHRIKETGVETSDDVRNLDESLVKFDPETRKEAVALKRYFVEHLYRSDYVMKRSAIAQIMLEEIYNSLVANPILLPSKHYKRWEEADNSIDQHSVIVNFIVGMTDSYAEKFYRKVVQKKGGIPLEFELIMEHDYPTL